MHTFTDITLTIIFSCFALPLFNSVAYDVKVQSRAAMKTMSTKMTSTFSDSKTFTNEMQEKMTTNNVESVSPNTITTDTSATPVDAGTLGKDNSVNNYDTPTPIPDDEEYHDEYLLTDAVFVVLCLVVIGVGVGICVCCCWCSSKQTKTKREEQVVEMVEQQHHDTAKNNPIHTHAFPGQPIVAQQQTCVPQLMNVTVPPGAASGFMLQLQTPTGQIVQVTVPPNMRPGMTFQIRY